MTTEPHRIIIRPFAEVDIADAAVWYDEQQPTLGHDFLSELESTIAAAAEHPLRHPRLRQKPEVRRILMQRFPYRVFFIRRDDAIVVFRVLHSARHDREWKSAARNES
jgi:plasmid stabilization system protein ParE